LISDADALKQILVSKSFKYHRPVEAESVNVFPQAQKNVFLSNGKDHSRMRKMVNPAFKVNNLKAMVEVFDEKAKLLAKVNLSVQLIIRMISRLIFISNSIKRGELAIKTSRPMRVV
jgi:cytochrome P450